MQKENEKKNHTKEYLIMLFNTSYIKKNFKATKLKKKRETDFKMTAYFSSEIQWEDNGTQS